MAARPFVTDGAFALHRTSLTTIGTSLVSLPAVLDGVEVDGFSINFSIMAVELWALPMGVDCSAGLKVDGFLSCDVSLSVPLSSGSLWDKLGSDCD
jgi:hypothetical protein